MEQTLIGKFGETAEVKKNETAIEYKKDGSWRSVSYGELKENIAALTDFLLREDIKEGDTAAVILGNGPLWPAVFFAVISAGAAVVPLNPEAGRRDTDLILRDSTPKMIFVQQESFLRKENASAEYPFVKKIIDTDSGEFGKILGRRSLSGPEKRRPLNTAAAACILYTSGTTGVSKGVMLSQGNFLANCDSLNKLNIISDSDRVISILPLHHAYPLTVTMLLPLLYGARVVYPQSMKSEDVSEAMQAKNPTVFAAVPQVFHALHKKISRKLNRTPAGIILKPVLAVLYALRMKTGINAARIILSSLHKKFGTAMRFFASGGAKLDEDAARGLLKLGFTIAEGYGLSETSPVLTFNPLNRPKIGSVGVPVPGVEVKIVNPQANGTGEVAARGPNVMKGYYKRDDLTKEVIKDGWFHTGDLGFFDNDGYLFLTGRSKDVIVLSSGLNVSPEEIEEAYTKDVPLKEICVFETPSPKGVQADFVLWAVVRPDLEFFKKYGEVNLKSVIKQRFDNISKSLPSPKRLMGFSITLEELPRTLLGKLKRFEVKNKYAPRAAGEKKEIKKQKELSEPDARLLNSAAGGKIIAHLKKQSGISAEIMPGDSLELDLGIDSLGRIELASGLERLFRVEIKDDVIGRVFTVRDLIAEIEALSACGAKTPPEAAGTAVPSGENYWKKLLQVPPEKENLEKLDLKPGFGMRLTGFLAVFAVYAFFKLFYRLKIEGRENVPAGKKRILYANHTSYFDGLIIAASLPRLPRLNTFFIGFRPYFNVPVIRNLIKAGRIIPIDFAAHFSEALRSCYYVLNHEKNLCIFPEGLRSLDGEIGEFKKGFGILAKESGAELIPVLIEGAYEAWPRTARFPGIHPIKIKFGKSRDVREMERRGRALGIKDGYQAICACAREDLLALKMT